MTGPVLTAGAVHAVNFDGVWSYAQTTGRPLWRSKKMLLAEGLVTDGSTLYWTDNERLYAQSASRP